ncbi:MAG: efflux RND transporter periplasmic adaptor subunit [Candidatus Eisenbacteria bacterium]|nr:efflux RND transporter periplasmic adaptor subunit [Candidatus Eisenbacteria bacterium]
MKTRAKITPIGVVLLGIPLCMGACGLSSCARKSAESRSAEEQQAVLVSAADLAVAETRRLEAGISFSGELQPTEIVEVVARFDGDLEKVLVKEGQAVRKGESLAVYKPRDIKDAEQAAEAECQAAASGLVAARNAEQRARRLLDAGAASPSDMEAAEAGRAAAEARARAAEAYRNRAQDDAERLAVPSPITGQVSKVMVHSGDRTAIGDRLAQVVDNSVLELSATVASEALGLVRRGAPIRFRIDAFPGESFEGNVDRVNPTTEPGTRQIRVYMRLPNPDGRLVGGLFASGRVIDETREGATAAPLAAIRKEGQEQVVYRLEKGVARRVPVRIGLVDEEAGVGEMIGQLAPGDSLLTGVLPGLRDGVAIRILRRTD